MPDHHFLKGEIQRVSYYNQETGFCVLQVRATGIREPVTLVGRTTVAQAGEQFEARGHWIVDQRYGRQFRADDLQTFAPTTTEGMQRYLASGAIRGIGPKLAERMAALYGKKLLDVLNHHPDLLLHVRGIGQKKLAEIKRSWEQTRHVRRIMLFLYEHGVSTGRAFRIYRRYGDRAIELIRENPYRLADDIWGIGFKTADELAQRLGIDSHSPRRAEAATIHILQNASHEGHCALPQETVIRQVEQLTTIPHESIVAAIEGLVADQRLIQDRLIDTPGLWLPKLHRAEWNIAQALTKLKHTGRHPLAGIELDRAICWVQERLKIELAPQQVEAVRQAVTRKVLIVTGGPGVGKTTIVRSIVEIFTAKGKQCVLAAPTGRAAKRLEETTGRPAKTVHRLLEFSPQDGGFRRGPDLPLSGDLFVLDEASMLDVNLAASLVRAVPAHACLVLVGDIDQLPSVGPGNVLADLIHSDTLPVVRLTTIFRQSQQSRIVQAAHAINAGHSPPLDHPDEGLSDFYFIPADEPDQIASLVSELVTRRIPARFGFHPLRDIQVLVPMNRSRLGAHQLNRELQTALNPQTDDACVERYGWRFSVGDRVIQLENDYQRHVYNGDQGIITGLNRVDQVLTVQFDDRTVDYEFNELDELALAYALTIHKSQGSEYPCVVLPLHTQHYMLLQRNLLYTAVTRGKRLVVIVGSHRALQMAVRRSDARRRYSALAERLQATASR